MAEWLIIPAGADLPLFITASLVLLATPGPAVLYIIACSVEHGRLAGFVSSMGVMVGGSLHAVLAAVGLAAILKTHPALLDGVKILGGLYLVYLSVRSFQAAQADKGDAPVLIKRKRSLFLQGIVVNLMNPKTILFFVAFFPQFTDPLRGPLMAQMFGLGVMFVSLGMVTDAIYSYAASGASKWFKGHPHYVSARSRIAGVSFLALGCLALAEGLRG